jgi:hypothetical protein
MPRHARIDAPGAVHHLMVRGITRSAIFYDGVDREQFIDRAGMVFAEERTMFKGGLNVFWISHTIFLQYP